MKDLVLQPVPTRGGAVEGLPGAVSCSFQRTKPSDISQGMHGMWYAGSSVIFESVPAVMEYNELLLRQMEE